MRQQHSFLRRLVGFPKGLVVGLAIVCLAGAQHACQPGAPEHSDAPEEPTAEHAPETGGGEVHWTYDGETGAARWGELDPSFAVCAEGAQQSPVDLAGPAPADAGTLDIQWQPGEAHVVDNGHTIQVDMGEGSSITLEGRRFSLLQFHFHSPSEHAVDGDRFPMEVHFVHQAEEGDLAVVGVFMDTGESHSAIESIQGAIPGPGEPPATLQELDPRALLPGEAGYFRYAGSLTTPPCSEVVSWVVMTEPISVSPAQAGAFAARHAMNARPLQAMNRRFILLQR
ncbi:MAG: carbonic anhydrase family protein [Gemmatimonadetes bacterium]|nr:carbonic anhydrase family protein [Gemmatimonadota bacterium]